MKVLTLQIYAMRHHLKQAVDLIKIVMMIKL